jgi:hypothetical protein
MVVTVPRSLVEAASAQCDWLPYTGEDNCQPIEDQGAGRVSIATSAGLYNPAWYAVIGQPTLVLDGSTALYAMRVLTALLCAVGLAAAAWALGVAGAGRWTRFGFLAALTPVLAYSTVVPGPNGPEIVAGLLLWACLLSLFKAADSDRRHDAALLVVASIAGIILATLRSIGPMWLGLIVLSVMATVGIRAVLIALTRQPVRWAVASGAVAVAVLGGIWWTLNAGLTNTSPDILDTGPDDDFSLGAKPLAWTLQMIAAFPLRRDFAPATVYLCGALVIGFLLVAAMVQSAGTRRLLVFALVLTALVLPIVMTLLTVESQGAIWQGRYQLPWATGILVVSGMQLDRRGFLRREGVRPFLVAGALLALAHAWSVWGVAHREATHEVSSVDPSWVTLPPLVLAAGCLATWLTLFVLVVRDETPSVAPEAGHSPAPTPTQGLARGERQT